jgi:hypothetical protein
MLKPLVKGVAAQELRTMLGGKSPLPGRCESPKDTWMGRPVDEMSREELVEALRAATCLVRSASLLRPDVEVRETSAGTVVGRTFNWAFLSAGQIWSDDDRLAIQSRLNAFAARHGLEGAIVRFSEDRLEVEVPRRLQAEQVVALQDWLDGERETLDASQVP